MRSLLGILLLLASGFASAQFVYPKPEYNKSEPGLYVEDPFIIQYRKKFFAVFKGDFKTFDAAFAEIEGMVKKNPKDARAMVWLGNGQTVRAGLYLTTGKAPEAFELIKTSRETLDKAVALNPKDPNIYMMRAATLFIQGQYFPADKLPKKLWETLRDDCLKFIAYVGEDRMLRASIHLRGEAYGELGIAYARLGEKDKAIAAFRRVIELTPGTSYEARAKREIEKLAKQ